MLRETKSAFGGTKLTTKMPEEPKIIMPRLIIVIFSLMLLCLPNRKPIYPNDAIDPKKVNEAIDKGVNYLIKHGTKNVRDFELVAYALIHAGLPKNHPTVQALIQKILAKPFLLTYNVALTAMVLESYDQVKYQYRIAECAQALVNYQCLNGQWSYSSRFRSDEATHPELSKGPAQPIEIITEASITKTPLTVALKTFVIKRLRKTRERDGDNSNTQFALLGLRAAARSNIIIPAETWKESAGFLVKSQVDDGGWNYASVAESNFNQPSYGSMTCASLCSLALAKGYLKEDINNDPSIKKGLAWLANNLRFDLNPNVVTMGLFGNQPKFWHYYYIYGVERVGAVLDLEKIGNHDWYEEGAKFLIEYQGKDGRWTEDAANNFGSDITTTAFALLFLKKATPKFKPVLVLTGEPAKPTPPESKPPEEPPEEK